VLAGRKDMIIRVWPGEHLSLEVEGVIARHPAVGEVRRVGVPRQQCSGSGSVRAVP